MWFCKITKIRWKKRVSNEEFFNNSNKNHLCSKSERISWNVLAKMELTHCGLNNKRVVNAFRNDVSSISSAFYQQPILFLKKIIRQKHLQLFIEEAIRLKSKIISKQFSINIFLVITVQEKERLDWTMHVLTWQRIIMI